MSTSNQVWWIEYQGQKSAPVLWNLESDARRHGIRLAKKGAKDVRLYNNLSRAIVWLAQGSIPANS